MSLRPTLRLSAVCLLATIVVAISGITNQASAQTSIVLYQFGSNTGDPLSPMYPAVLTQGRDGSLYSTAPKGGANGNGAAYRISPSGTFSVVHSFLADKSEGTNCLSGLNIGRDGNFYGVCQASLSALEGTAYSLNASGTFKLVHAFLGSPNDGGWVYGAPIQALDNTFYGATWNGGAGGGLAYKTDASGSGYKVIYDFGKAPGDAFAIYSSFVQGSDKYLYVGAASGAIVKLSTAGKETVLYTLNDPSRGDGLNLLAGLIQGSDGYFYGCTQMGGIYGYGTVFKVSSKGSFTVLRRFGAIGSRMDSIATRP